MGSEKDCGGGSVMWSLYNDKEEVGKDQKQHLLKE